VTATLSAFITAMRDQDDFTAIAILDELGLDILFSAAAALALADVADAPITALPDRPVI
jgi:hypothetical protein